jgi:acetyl-CoA carboxylase biotin carboxylase subunit
MEMNTRIQVEHPVTEEVTGVDLIAAQIRVAAGEPLWLRQSDIRARGWCLEARINAEDPERGFLPAPGRVDRLRFPMGPGIRVDSHMYEGYTIPAAYDSMVAKLIVSGSSREDAIARMLRALAEFELDGPPTTICFHEALLQNEVFRSGQFTTRFLEEQEPYFREYFELGGEQSGVEKEWLAILAAVVHASESLQSAALERGSDRENWRRQSRRESVHS